MKKMFCMLPFQLARTAMSLAQGVLLGAFILFHPFALEGYAQTPAAGQAPVAIEELESAFRLVRNEMETFPTENFSPAALQAALGDAPEDLRDWVAARTVWVPYTGAMRGATGVMLDRMGSHLDRALLLGEMLRAGGHEVRFASAPLQMASPPGRVGAPPILRKEVPATAENESLGMDGNMLERDLENAAGFVQRQHEEMLAVTLPSFEALRALLPDEAPSDDFSAEALPAILAAANDYWWVQVNGDSGWSDLHIPAAGFEIPADLMSKNTYAFEALPTEVFHRLRVEVLVTRAESGKSVQGKALEFERSLIAMDGQALQIQFQPNAEQTISTFQDEAGDFHPEIFRQVMNAYTEWTPMIRFAGETLYEKSFREDGSINDKPFEPPAAAAFGSALNALGGMKTAKAETHLLAVHLRHTVQAPGIPDRVYDRALFDFGADAGADSADWAPNDEQAFQRILALAGSSMLMPQTHWITQEYGLYRANEGLLKNRTAMLGLYHAAARSDLALSQKAAQHLEAQPGALMNLAYIRSALSPVAGATALTRVNLLRTYQEPVLRENALMWTRGLDILENEVDALPHADFSARDIRAMQGVFDTVAEAMLAPVTGEVVNTALRFHADLAGGRPWVRIDSQEVLAAHGGTWSDALRREAAKALAEGNWILVEGGRESPDVFWRLHPERGDLLGMSASGRGDFIQYLTVQNISMVLTLAGILACVPKGGTSGNNTGCCMAIWGAGEMGVLALVWYLGGGAVAAAAGLGAALLYGVVTNKGPC